ncbi:hypothetical protein KCP69_08155 [Salmonella enterica subsp. enterica]|nr:hypothetical protein KCP69_08155 [Salmonella enterica subsp. enterica]
MVDEVWWLWSRKRTAAPAGTSCRLVMRFVQVFTCWRTSKRIRGNDLATDHTTARSET